MGTMTPVSSIVPLIGSAVHAVNALLEWLLTYAIHSTLLIGGLLLVTSTAVGRRLMAGHGSWLWRFALVGAVITASLQSIRSSAPLAGTLRLDRNTPPRTMVRIDIQQDGPMVGVAPSWTSPTATRHVTSSIQVRPLWPFYMLAAWFVVAAALVTWFLVARARFLRFIGPRRPAKHTLAGNALRHLQREGRISRNVRLTLSDRLTSPVALGGDEICLPERALAELGPVRMESILAHELAHLVRGDPGWLTIARLIEAIFFFQPLNILARRRMQEAAEFASDAWASTRVARPLDLAHCLARVAEWTIAAPRLPVPAMAERRGAVLVRRVERLTTGRVIPEVAPGRGVRLGAAVAVVGLVLLAPRAAIGADRALDGTFEATVPAGRFLMLREVDVGPPTFVQRGNVGAIVMRVRR
jgi:Zn-dependent protease with chaperone function